MNKVKIGVFGAGRGSSMIQYCIDAQNAELVAICDKNERLIAEKKKEDECKNVTFYTSFDEFLNHDMDAVVLANYATEHAKYAVKCLEKGLHVLSEVLPVQTMNEAVELTEAVEKSGKIYSYAENYCYMPAAYEMRKLYREGKLGNFEYGEGEYMHNCEGIWGNITHGDPSHWRNTMYATYYCTHSMGPLIHITGLRPIKVVGFEVPYNDRMARCGAKAGPIGIEMVTLENGGIVKSLHGVGCSRNSIWYSIYGSLGRCESAREDAENGGMSVIYTNLDSFEGQNSNHVTKYAPEFKVSEQAAGYGHGSSDFFTMYNFTEKILGNENADIIDVYEALDMFLPGLLAYRSVLNGGIPVDIPNFRKKEERDKYRNDVACVDPEIAGDQWIPSFSEGDVFVEPSVYDKFKNM